MKRELSGHVVKVMPFFTYKYEPKSNWFGGDEVYLQAETMRAVYSKALHASIVPRIWMRTRRSYVMSTKLPLDEEWNWMTVRNMLAVNVWSLKEKELMPDYIRRPHFSTGMLYAWMDEHCPDFLSRVMPSSRYLESLYERADEATHGDPTSENTLLNKDGSYCLIDWQPFRLAIRPASRDVDYGRFLQGVLGWRDLLYLSAGVFNDSYQIMLECPMAWFWCALNYMRIKARAPHNEQLHVYCDQRLEFLAYLKRKAV